MKYKAPTRSVYTKRSHLARRLFIVVIVVVALLATATLVIRQVYYRNLQPVDASSQQSQLFTVELGQTAEEIADSLDQAGLIRSAWAFRLYVSSKQVRGELQAGTYSLSPAQSVSEIVAQLTHGRVATDTVTILPGQRLDQIRETLINSGFDASDVDAALDASNYIGNPALVDKPTEASLEGYIYPETFHKTDSTTARQIIEQALDEMSKQLTPDLRSAFANKGLSVYEGVVLASIVEKEAANAEDRSQIAQVLFKRLQIGMLLQADPTAFYGAILAGAEPSLSFDSLYNTYLYEGLPPTPISNVGAQALQAVAYPADTDWLYFVAGDDGQTHFSRTLEEHETATRLYCTEACQ